MRIKAYHGKFTFGLRLEQTWHSSNCFWPEGEKSRRSRRKPRIPASVSATYSSTVAEELLALLRKLHTLEAWNPLVNEFISAQLKSIVTMVTLAEPVQEDGETQVGPFGGGSVSQSDRQPVCELSFVRSVSRSVSQKLINLSVNQSVRSSISQLFSYSVRQSISW